MKLIIALIIGLIFINIFVKCGSETKFYERFDSTIKYDSKYKSIPKIIIQTWKSQDIPKRYMEDLKSLRKFNPDFKFMFFTDQDIEIFLKNNYPDWYITWIKLPVLIQKIDFFRYIAVYHFGGFYFDLDMTGLKSLDSLLNYNCVFPIDQHIQNCNTDRLINFCNRDIKYLLGQYAFGARPRDLFIKKLIDTIHINIDQYIKTVNDFDHEIYIYRTTGPDFVTNVFLDYPNKNQIQILDYPDGQFFGEFAKHNYYGTWKK